MNEKSIQIIVTGLVQGVGFRPFIFRIARRFELRGSVLNTNENVKILVTGTPQNIELFVLCLTREAPSAAMIENVSIIETVTHCCTEFKILESQDQGGEITEISPDISVCEACLTDMDRPGTRYEYAFVNCTNCGPRFTIIRDLPYDRAKTTMKSFKMCEDCQKEYDTPLDRRFHAQPTACRDCGPFYELFIENKSVSTTINVILDRVSECINGGGIVLIKGLGGMHLACDAFNQSSVERLRNLKNRDGKPFAVMFRDMGSLSSYAEINTTEAQSLFSWRRPIVLLEQKKKPIGSILANSLNAGLVLLGVMLPYMPFHYLLFRRLKTSAIVLTSGNFSSEPILIDNKRAIEQFSHLVDASVVHNRTIYNRTDDSVVRIIGGMERVMRRSRGYVPVPIRTNLNTDGIIAFGAELTNSFCVGKGQKAFLSQHIGDLMDMETTLFYQKTITQFIKLFRIKPALLCTDFHPDYISTKTALDFGDFPIVHVQHHHAHIASCMAEHHLDEKVIGVALDGSGYGTDGHTWGSEFMICDLEDFSRVTHFEYIPLPGGDLATEQPWRIAVSYLYKVFGNDFTHLVLPMHKQLDPEKIRLITSMIDKQINCPLTSGAGRLFDCVASLLDLVQIASFQAEGPMRLESIIRKDIADSYKFSRSDTICFDQTIRGIVEDILLGEDQATISTKFHNTIILAIFETVNAICLKSKINKVVLSGGVFQNKFLLERTIEVLEKNQFEVYSHVTVPTGDGGISLGQLAVASKWRELRCV